MTLVVGLCCLSAYSTSFYIFPRIWKIMCGWWSVKYRKWHNITVKWNTCIVKKSIEFRFAPADCADVGIQIVRLAVKQRQIPLKCFLQYVICSHFLCLHNHYDNNIFSRIEKLAVDIDRMRRLILAVILHKIWRLFVENLDVCHCRLAVV